MDEYSDELVSEGEDVGRDAYDFQKTWWVNGLIILRGVDVRTMYQVNHSAVLSHVAAFLMKC